MPRPALIALALVPVLLFASAGTAVVGTAPGPAADPEPAGPARDVEALDVGPPSRTGFANQSIDVATAVATDREAVTARLDRHALDVAFDRAEGEQARRELLFEAATDVEIAVSSLRSEQRALRRGYADGSIGGETFLRRSAVLDARAEQLTGDLDRIEEYAGRIPGFSMRTRIDTLRASLTGFGGPASERVRASVAGERGPVLFSVSASRNGTVMAMIADGEYVREAYRADHWAPDSTNSIGLDEVEARAGELYPVAFNSSQTISRGIGIVDADVYRIEVGYEQGSILAYMDGDTRDVFYEIQRRPLNRIDPGPAVTATNGSVRLSVNRTHVGGPLRIAVASNVTGAPVDALVTVDGVRFRTGPDGVVWALMPDGPTEIVAATDRGSATVVVAPQ